MARNDGVCMRERVHFEVLEPRLLLDSAPLDWPLAFERSPAEWTVMVYLDADNNLEGAGIDDVNEMEAVGSTSSVNILVQFDRRSGHDTSNGDWTDTRRGRIVNDADMLVINTPLMSIGEVNMGAPATLTSFIQWGVTTYPANRYAVILWDHGGGTSGVCWDDTDYDHLTVAEVGQGLASAGVQMDMVGFDACLMAMMEQAYEIRDYAGIMVASEQTEPWDGWSYDTFLADLVADPTQAPATLASSIVTRYGQSYGGAETLSAVDVPGVQSLAGDLDTFAATVIAEDTDWGAISAARISAGYFSDTDYRDLGTFIDGVVSYASNVNIITAAQAVQATYASAIISNHSGPGEGATGLSIYLPAQGGSVSGSYTAANFDLLADTRWDEFLQAFTGSSGGGGTDLDGSIPDAGPAGSLPATISGFIQLDGVENVGGQDVDFYSLSVVPGQQIGFDIDAREMGGSLDPVLRLFDSNGVELDMNDDAYDPDTNQYTYDSYIEYTFTKAEAVYIAVSGYSNWSYDPWTTGSGTAGSTGAYDLLIRDLGGPVTDVNGTIPTATSLGSAPASYSAAIGDEPVGEKDVDFYALDVESNQGLTISVASGGSGLDAYLKIFAGDGTLLASDDNTSGVDPEIDYDFSALGAGTYYVAVSGVPNTNYDPFALGSAVSGSTGNYTLNVIGHSVHLDFDGVIPRANAIGAPPASMTGSIGDEPAGSLDVDFYAVDVAAGHVVGFDIDAEELGYSLDSVLRLFNQYGTELASSDDGTDPDSGFVGSDPYIEYTFAIGGTYYIAVSGAPNDVYFPFAEISGVPGDQGDYELHVCSIGTGSDLNGTIPTATPAGSLPATMVGSIADEAAGALDVDFYAVNALAGQRIGFDIDARDNGSLLDSMLRLFDDGGTELAGNDDASDPDTGVSSYDSYLTYLFSADGTYYIAVSGFYNDEYDPFVEMSGTPGSTGDYELLIREVGSGPQGQVGPDGFGYIGYPVTPEFEDIDGTGSVEFTPYVDDDYFYLSPADLTGFEFDFYGTTYQNLYVSSNGLITFGSGYDEYENTNLTMYPFQAAIAPYWDDLVVDDSPDAAVLWEVRGSGDQQRLIVQWNDIRYIAGSGQGQITFQAVLDETDDSMQFNYLDLASSSSHAEGASATVGIKDAGLQSIGEYILQISINEGPNDFVGTGLSTRVDLQGPTTPVGANVWLVPRITPSAADTSATLPDSDRDPFWQRETCDYYVEIWIRSDPNQPAAISGGSVEVTFDPQYAQAAEVDHGGVFTTLPVEDIDNVTGSVSLGGETSHTDKGDDEYVLLGRIRFQGDAPVDEVGHQLGPYDTLLTATDGPTDFALIGIGNVDVGFQAVPTVDIRANIYDIDDSGQVDFGDFSYFVPAFMHTVSEPEPPYIWWADFDESGQVDFGDFSYFVTAFMKPFCDPGIVFPAGRFESTRLADTPESPLAIALSPTQAPGAEAASVEAVQLQAVAPRNFPALLEPEITRATPIDPAVMYAPNRLARQAVDTAWMTDAPVDVVTVPVLGLGDWMADSPNPKFRQEMEKTLPVQPVIGASRLVAEKKGVRLGQPVAVPVLDVLRDIATLDTDL